MLIGARIYYEKTTGNVILNTGQRSGSVKERTVEQDFNDYNELAQRVPEMVGMIQLEYGEYEDDLGEGGVITSINLETLVPLFTYPEPDPETPIEPRPSLAQQVDELGKRQQLMQKAIDDLVMGGML
ncbi:hypothetical protein B2I21_35170 [Chryseobacterium mucoviscidosis]|nr:hypothetical protein B2I21_35170 [Chryseobacterium mucoviscidosis]